MKNLIKNNLILILILIYSYSLPLMAKPAASLCDDYNGLPQHNHNAPKGMVLIEGGSFIMGNNEGHEDEDIQHYQYYPEERGEHTVHLESFWLDQHEVTNAQFYEFVQATHYMTVAERKPKQEWLPEDFPKEDLVPGSAVFNIPKDIDDTQDFLQWWEYVQGANWAHPEGPKSNITNRMNHPVVHITYEDAQAYATWAGRELPTEAQWEYAARGGLKLAKYTWGNSLLPNKQWMANTWQGQFPVENTIQDGFLGTSPVGCYPPNKFDLYDMAGNVWEIVQDKFRPGHQLKTMYNPTGPTQSFDPYEPNIAKHVIKGGSFLCSPNYCMRYRPAARQPGDYTMGTSHIGFRTVLNIKNK